MRKGREVEGSEDRFGMAGMNDILPTGLYTRGHCPNTSFSVDSLKLTNRFPSQKKEKMMATHFENMTCQNIPEQNSKLKEANCCASEFYQGRILPIVVNQTLLFYIVTTVGLSLTLTLLVT